jgi:hypothetical protein
VALAVQDMKKATEELKKNGTQLIEMGNQVFIHPRETHGVLYQLIERK